MQENKPVVAILMMKEWIGFIRMRSQDRKRAGKVML